MSEFQQEMMKHSEELGSFASSWAHYQYHGAAQAIRYLVDRKVRVINISSLLERSLCKSAEVWDELQSAFAYAADRDVVVVLGAGNNAANLEQYPGRSESTIVVGAATKDDQRWEVELETMAHLRRLDCHWNLVRQMATAIYCFQPLMWVLSRRIEITAEEVCDDIVVSTGGTGGDRHDYAHRLVDIAEFPPTFRPQQLQQPESTSFPSEACSLGASIVSWTLHVAYRRASATY